MSYNPQEGYPRAVPELIYRDANAAISWLSRVFGLREVLRLTDESGSVRHADMELDGGVVMLKAEEGPFRSAAAVGHPTSIVVFFIDDVDRHFEWARSQGATVLSSPENKPWGLRQYIAMDLEGHAWEFSQHLHDVHPQDWNATVAEDDD